MERRDFLVSISLVAPLAARALPAVERRCSACSAALDERGICVDTECPLKELPCCSVRGGGHDAMERYR
jgi:hypothetical protein